MIGLKDEDGSDAERTNHSEAKQMASENGLVQVASRYSVEETVRRLETAFAEKGMRVFAVIDHSGEARAAGLELRETRVVIFGSPAAGTAVMEEVPLAALDLPLKVLVWADGDQTRVSYAPPATLAARYGLRADLAGRLAGIEVVVEAALTRDR